MKPDYKFSDDIVDEFSQTQESISGPCISMGKKKMWYFLFCYSFNRKHIITQYFWQEPGPSCFKKKKHNGIL